VLLWLLWTITSSLLHYAVIIAFIHYAEKTNPGACYGQNILILIQLTVFNIIWKLTLFPRYCKFVGNGARFLATRVILEEEEDNNHEEGGSPDTSTTVIL